MKLLGINSTPNIDPRGYNWRGSGWRACVWEERAGWQWEFDSGTLYLGTRKHYQSVYSAHAAMVRVVRKLRGAP